MRNTSVSMPAQNTGTRVVASKFRSQSYFIGCSEQIAKTIKMFDPLFEFGFKSHTSYVNAGSIDKCATKLHSVEEQHTLRFDLKILGFSKNLQNHLVLDMLHISTAMGL